MSSTRTAITLGSYRSAKSLKSLSTPAAPARSAVSERRNYLDSLAAFEKAMRGCDLEAARGHLSDAQIPANQADDIIGRILANPQKYGYGASSLSTNN